VFGSDAILYGSEGSWADLFRRPRELKRQAAIPDAVTGLAIVAPMYVVVSGLLGGASGVSMPARLMAMAGASIFLFIVLPLAIARLQGVRAKTGFQWHGPSPLAVAAAVVLGCTLWPLAYDLIILCQNVGIATLSAEKLAESRPELMAHIERLREVPPWIVLLAIAIAPAIGEEFFFRGYLLGALRGRMPAWGAIVLTGAVFGLFHANVGGLIAVERVLSSMLLGLVLGWICWHTGSVIPGMVLHALSNGLMVSLVYLGPHLKAWGLDTENQTYLPLPLVAVTTAVAVTAIVVLSRSTRRESELLARVSSPAAPVSSPPS
jgi:ABC-2 type transport system permease protein/sodium transport system permease protein